MQTQSRLLALVTFAGCGLLACGSSGGGLNSGGSSGASSAGSGAAPAAGSAGTAAVTAGSSGMTSEGGTVGVAGADTGAGTGGVGTGGVPIVAGAGGAPATGGTAGAPAVGGAGGSGGSGEDIPPWRDLNITVAPGQHTHTTPVGGHSAGMDNRSAKMAGKLVIDMGVGAGGYQSYLGKRGFHVIGIGDNNDCNGIDDWTLGRDFDTNCRLNTLDGMPHGNQSTVSPQNSIMNQVLQALITFEAQFPGEGWGYFLTKDGKAVRWSDVAFTGFSHGAQSAACFATQLRVWRAVSQSGPRDNTCGKGPAKGAYDPNNLPFDPNCPVEHIASWIDAPSATPIDRYWAFTGGMDGQFGDIMFTMQRMKFVGDYVNLDTATAPYGGSHRFYSLNAGHNGFPDGFPIAAINLAFDVAPENAKPTF